MCGGGNSVCFVVLLKRNYYILSHSELKLFACRRISPLLERHENIFLNASHCNIWSALL